MIPLYNFFMSYKWANLNFAQICLSYNDIFEVLYLPCSWMIYRIQNLLCNFLDLLNYSYDFCLSIYNIAASNDTGFLILIGVNVVEYNIWYVKLQRLFLIDKVFEIFKFDFTCCDFKSYSWNYLIIVNTIDHEERHYVLKF